MMELVTYEWNSDRGTVIYAGGLRGVSEQRRCKEHRHRIWPKFVSYLIFCHAVDISVLPKRGSVIRRWSCVWESCLGMVIKTGHSDRKESGPKLVNGLVSCHVLDISVLFRGDLIMLRSSFATENK